MSSTTTSTCVMHEVSAVSAAPRPPHDDLTWRLWCGLWHQGSQVTGMSPFQIWLNEAVTVHVQVRFVSTMLQRLWSAIAYSHRSRTRHQRKREHQLFGDDFRRLYEVLLAFRPGTGPLAQDESAVAMPIEPVGFNRTQELISAMTYQKAPEFVRMIETLLTPPVFVRGLHRTLRWQ